MLYIKRFNVLCLVQKLNLFCGECCKLSRPNLELPVMSSENHQSLVNVPTLLHLQLFEKQVALAFPTTRSQRKGFRQPHYGTNSGN